MINLFFVMHDFSGARTYADELLGYYTREEAEVHIYKIYLESSYNKEYTTVEKNGILEVYIPAVKRKGNNLEKYASRCIDLIMPVVSGKMNLIFHLNYPTQVKFGEEARKKFGAKLVYTLHYLPEYFSYAGNEETKVTNLVKIIDVLDIEVLKTVDKIICISKFAQNTLVKQFDIPIEKTEHIYNGYGVTNCKKPNSVADNKKNLGFDVYQRVIFFAGKLDDKKGVPALINVFKKIAMEFSNARLVLAGEGNFKEIMELCYDVAGKVTFTGSLGKKQLRKFYSIADIGVSPSRWELFGYVPVEMMYYRIPVVISDVPGMNELVKDGINGLVCSVRKKTDGVLGLEVDEDDLYAKIKKLLENNTLARQLARNGRLNWAHKFTSRHMGQATKELYYHLLEEQNANTQTIINNDTKIKI